MRSGPGLVRMIYSVCGGGVALGDGSIPGWWWGLLDVCVYNKIAEDKSFSIMIIVPDAALSTSVRTTPELEVEPEIPSQPVNTINKKNAAWRSP